MNDIDQLRSEMDLITIKMVKLLKKRTILAKKIGVLKHLIGKEITDEHREHILREKILNICNSIDLNSATAIKLLNFLVTDSIKIQSATKQNNVTPFLKSKQLESEGKKIIHMEIGEPNFKPPLTIKKSLSEIYDKGFTKYDTAQGMLTLRLKISKYILMKSNIAISPNNIIVCPGARFAIYLILSIFRPGDELILIDPSWSAYKDFALYFGIKTTIIKTTLENNWEPDIAKIKNAITSNTKMIIINYPNNPTGKILSSSTQNKIMKLIMNNNIYVLSDEIYSCYAYKNWKSILSYNYAKSIVVQSFSKSHSMTGFRIGYVIAPTEIISNMSHHQSLCMTNVSTPIQYVALYALNTNTSNNTNIMKSRLNTVIKKAHDIGLNFMKPDGGMYIFAKIKNANFNSITLFNTLLNKGLAISPGMMFGTYKNFIRISVACQNKDKLIKGMNILNNTLNE